MEVSDAEEDRTWRLLAAHPAISLHDRREVAPEDITESGPWIREAHVATGYEGLARSGLAAVFENIGDFPNIVRWLVRHGYSDDDIAKAIGSNTLRALEQTWVRQLLRAAVALPPGDMTGRHDARLRGTHRLVTPWNVPRPQAHVRFPGCRKVEEEVMPTDQVDRTTVTTEPTPAGSETVRTASRHSTTTGPGGPELTRRIVVLLFGLIQLVIGARIVLLLLDAREANDLVSGILSVSQWFVAPFEGILRTDSLKAAGSVFDITAVVALVGWTVLEIIVLWAVGIFRRDPA